MTRARMTLIVLESTSYYHICVRVVRRSFLCGEDRFTGKNFDHRKQWLEGEQLRLSEIFAIDLSAYSIMSNHYHVILHVDKARTNQENMGVRSCKATSVQDSRPRILTMLMRTRVHLNCISQIGMTLARL